MKTVNLGEVIICRAVGNGIRISAPIVACGEYDDKRQPSLYDMEQIAWEVKTRNRGVTGFAPDKSLTIEIEPPNPYRNQPSPTSPVATDGPLEKEKEK